MDKLRVFFILLLSIGSKTFIKAIYGRAVVLGSFFKSIYSPYIRCRSGGKIIIKNVNFRSGVSIFADGGILEINEGAFINSGCSFNTRKKIYLGKNVLIGEGVKFYDHNHQVDDFYNVSFDLFEEAPIHIGDNCWIGSNCVVLKGVSICNNVVIGAGTILRKNIEESGVFVSDGRGGIKKIK